MDNNNCSWSADCRSLSREWNPEFHFSIVPLYLFECASIDLLLFALDRLTTTILFVFPHQPPTQPLTRSSVQDWMAIQGWWVANFLSFICAHTCADSTIDGYFPFTLARSPWTRKCRMVDILYLMPTTHSTPSLLHRVFQAHTMRWWSSTYFCWFFFLFFVFFFPLSRRRKDFRIRFFPSAISLHWTWLPLLHNPTPRLILLLLRLPLRSPSWPLVLMGITSDM